MAEPRPEIRTGGSGSSCGHPQVTQKILECLPHQHGTLSEDDIPISLFHCFAQLSLNIQTVFSSTIIHSLEMIASSLSQFQIHVSIVSM